MRKTKRVLSAGVIFQMLLASQALAWESNPEKRKEAVAELKVRSSSASEILLKMHAAELTLTDPQGRLLIGAYRVVTSGAA